MKCHLVCKSPVKFWAYDNIFSREYNLGFHRPKKDICIEELSFDIKKYFLISRIGIIDIENISKILKRHLVEKKFDNKRQMEGDSTCTRNN